MLRLAQRASFTARKATQEALGYRLVRDSVQRYAYSSTAGGAKSPAIRSRKWTKRLGYTATGLTAFYLLDTNFNASAVTRNFRTLWTCMLIAADYKLNFTPEKSDKIPELHERVATRVYDLLTTNGGLYIKIGQAIGNNAALLPKPMQEKFAKLFDDAPQIPYSAVRKVFEKEFGKPPDGPDGVFDVFEEQAVASASVAQVHRAKLKSGEWVAVKVQKPDVSKQVEWDLGAYRVVMWLYENYLFNLPVYFTVDFICDHLRRELDFIQEANNSMQTARFIASEPRLADRVYVPKVYPELTTQKVMVAEWIDGVRLSDRPGILRLMGEDDPRLTPTTSQNPNVPAVHVARPLKGGVKSVMNTMVELFSAQIFSWGWIHCDPHPGNVIIRPNPSNPRYPQLVLIDHGLYVRARPEFQQQYAMLWRALMSMDTSVIRDVALGWGIGTPDLFASATLMRPVNFAARDPEMARRAREFENMSQYERSVQMKERLKGFLTDTDKMPKELIFIGRNMRIVQGNNQMFGSPVNRIRVTGYWASRSLTTNPYSTFTSRLRAYVGYVTFLSVMFTIDVAFWSTKLRQWAFHVIGKQSVGFEDELEVAMRGFAKSNLGVEISPAAFEG